MESHYGLILRETDRRIKEALSEQNCDQNSRFFGAFYNSDGIAMVKQTVYRLMTMLSGWINEESVYYADALLEERILNGLSFVEKKQHSDGLFDYETCNFDSPPDTAFIMKKILPTFIFMMKTGKYPALAKRFEAILKNGADGLMLGGFHTPNHRWAIASVLAVCGTLWREDAYLREAERYLAEGIDINDDGEYAERSAGNYNRVNNDSMMMLSQALHQPIYETYAVRNLSMTLSYIEPDGSIFTENSTRFDKDLRIYPRYYYWQYLTLGHKYERADFLQTARAIMERVVQDHLRAPDILIQFMNQPELIPVADAPREKISLPSRFFQETGAVRDNTSDRSITILAHHPAFLHMQYRNIRIAVELLGSFFEHRGFVGDDISQTGNDEYTLCQSMIGWYYLPFETRPQTSDWWAMDNCKRPMRTGPTLKLQTKIALSGERLALSIRANGVEDAPFQLVFHVSGAQMRSSKENGVELSGEQGKVLIGPSFYELGQTQPAANSENNDGFSFNCYTPFEKQINIRFSAK